MASKIEWTDETWNPVTGCSKVSEGCRNCYAEALDKRFQFNGEHKPWTDAHAEHNVTLHHDRLKQPYHWNRKPRRIFVNSMSDLFHPQVPFEFIYEVFKVMCNTMGYGHKYMILTKRPEQMLEFMTNHLKDIPQNLPHVWLGVSVENQKAADERIPLLLKTPAAVRFLSCEPLLGPVNIFDVDDTIGMEGELLGLPNEPRLHWVIAGGESGPKARPMHPQWALDLLKQCESAKIPFFFKQWGEWGENSEGKFMNIKAEDIIFTASGEVLGAGHGKHGGSVVGDWRERGGAWMTKVGKKRAGRELDGRTHDDFPDAR